MREFCWVLYFLAFPWVSLIDLHSNFVILLHFHSFLIFFFSLVFSLFLSSSVFLFSLSLLVLEIESLWFHIDLHLPRTHLLDELLPVTCLCEKKIWIKVFLHCSLIKIIFQLSHLNFSSVWFYAKELKANSVTYVADGTTVGLHGISDWVFLTLIDSHFSASEALKISNALVFISTSVCHSHIHDNRKQYLLRMDYLFWLLWDTYLRLFEKKHWLCVWEGKCWSMQNFSSILSQKSLMDAAVCSFPHSIPCLSTCRIILLFDYSPLFERYILLWIHYQINISSDSIFYFRVVWRVLSCQWFVLISSVLYEVYYTGIL